jgi:hypothetical protein
MILRPKSSNQSCRFWGLNRKIRSHQFWGQIRRNCRHRFWGHGRNRTSGFKAKQLINYRSWFWDSTKKLALLVSLCTVQTAHDVTRPPDRPATEYPTCATILGPLHQVFYSCHDPHCCPPCHTSHLHTMRQANMILHIKQGIKVKLPKCPRFEFKPRHINDSSHIKTRYWSFGFSLKKFNRAPPISMHLWGATKVCVNK